MFWRTENRRSDSKATIAPDTMMDTFLLVTGKMASSMRDTSKGIFKGRNPERLLLHKAVFPLGVLRGIHSANDSLLKEVQSLI